ncbi:MAG: hypothetical protein VYD19_07420, partial [Myxococcota bacterium]|nr:hypothetical protein [Myxococcota bacterium]
TGYGFVEMHLWAERAAAQMIKGEPLSQFQAPMLRSWMDRCLLRIIEHKPERLPGIFIRLATYASGDQFARFMTSCKYSDAFAMICRAPKLPFLYSALGKTQWI